MTSSRSIILVGSVLAAIAACYGVSLRAASERAGVVAGRAQIARDIADMRLLRAELRTRSRLPELQRWNEQVLALAPPRAEQLVANPVMLASYAAPIAPPAAPPVPAPLTAVVRDAPPLPPVLSRASFAPRAADLGRDAARVDLGRDAARVDLGRDAARVDQADLGSDAARVDRTSLGGDAARAGRPATLRIGFQKVALR